MSHTERIGIVFSVRIGEVLTEFGKSAIFGMAEVNGSSKQWLR